VNIARLLADAARERPAHPALVFEGHSIPYEALDRLVNRFANAVRALGVPERGVLALFLESCPELVIAYLGALKAGVVPNVVNGFLRPEEVRHVVADSGARLIVTDPGRHDQLAPVAHDMGTDRAVVTGWAHDVGDDLAFDGLLASQPEVFPAADLDPGALANLLYTSGTTGNPKGVMLSHRNVVHNAETFASVHYSAGERLLVAAPLFHCWGLINGVLATFAARGTALLVRRFQTEPVLDLIERERATSMIGVAAMYNYMNRSPDFERRDLSSLRFVLSAAAPTPLELIDVLRNRWKVGYAESYGLTETSPVITTTHHSENRPGSCGRAMDDTRLRVVDAHRRELPAGEVGELWAAGTAISAGYYRKPEATAAVFTPDGWFRTGDIAKVEPDGYVYIVDRLKDMINVGGEKVYPRDVEEVLYRHPAVADAVVIGVPDPDRGEAVKAFVVRKPGTACTPGDLIEFLRPHVAAFKVPREVEFTEEIPRSPSGKALRRLLRG
jgi:long-chain acyl-CoA synthetase